MHVLLVEPTYYTQYPPLGLLKLATYHVLKGDTVELVHGCQHVSSIPERVYVTSLFTYAFKPVHQAINFYSKKYRKAQIVVGGIYATLAPEHLECFFGDKVEVWEGIHTEIEDVLPAYWLVPECNTSILFSSRGCIRKCSFCSVSQLEPIFEARESIKHLIYPGHKKVVLWDNNMLASPHWKNIFAELEESGLEVDFNQGIDARLLTEEVAIRLKRLKIRLIRLAYDSKGIKEPLREAIKLLNRMGIKGRKIIVYCLHNHSDTPADFLERIQDLISWGVVSYPMRYQSLEPAPKDSYVSPKWTRQRLDMIAKARRVIGYGGAFPPYDGLKRKFTDARTFEDAFQLRPLQGSCNLERAQN